MNEVAAEPLAIITPTPMRRTVSFLVLAALGVLLVYFGFSIPSVALGWKLALVGSGLGVLLLADKLRRATALSIILTQDALVDSSGREICRISDISGIDRGALAFKPSNGFLIRTRTSMPRAWAPGLWWRLGRSIGIGGTTPAGQAKFMAEMLAARIQSD